MDNHEDEIMNINNIEDEIIDNYEPGDSVNVFVNGRWRPGTINALESCTVINHLTGRQRDVTPEFIRGNIEDNSRIEFRTNLRNDSWAPGTIVFLNYTVNMADWIGGTEDVSHTNIRRRLLDLEPPHTPEGTPPGTPPRTPPGPPPGYHQQQLPGVAFEIHNAFPELNFRKFMTIVRRDNNGASNFKDPTYPLQPLITYINTDTNTTIVDTEKTDITRHLNGEIKTRLNMYLSGRPENRDNVMEMTQFVMSQGPDYKDPYIRFLAFDCMNAYSRNPGDPEERGASCPQGVFERVFLINKSVLVPLCGDDTSSSASSSASSSTSTCKELYRELLGCFYPDMDLNALFGEWYAINNLEEGSTSPLENASEEERKEDFRRFVLHKVPRADPTAINNYIQRNENTFKTLLIGGRRKRRNRKTKRKTLRKGKGKDKRKTKRRY